MADLGLDFAEDDYEQDEFYSEEPSITEEIDQGKSQVQKQAPVESTNDVTNVSEPNKLIEATGTDEELEDELLTDENITPIERVYGFRDNDALINRLLLAKELPNALDEISLKEAIEDIIPVMIKLACDKEDTVRETFASELDQLLIYFYKNSPETFYSESSKSDESFSDTLIRLLLDQSSGVATLAQQAIVIVVNELVQLSNDNSSYQKVIKSEIVDGVINGLMLLIEGKKKTPRVQDEEEEEANKKANKSTEEVPNDQSSPESELSLNVHYAFSEDDVDQGELSLAKIACISLISSLVGSFNEEQCVRLYLPIIEQLSNDTLFYVRKEVATSIGHLAQVVKQQTAEDRLLPLFRKFSEDQIWHVRRSCVFTLPSLAGVLSDASRHEITVSSLEIFRNDVSRNVRNALTDIVGELVAKFLPPDWQVTKQPGQLPHELLEYFLSLGSNNNSQNQTLKLEIDRTFICAYNFPAVVLTAGVEDYWDSHFRETYLNLTKDYQIKVRCTFAYSLHDIAALIGPERTERDLVQIFALYLMDLDDVKQGVLEHLSDFLGTLAVSSRNEYIPILAEVWDGVANNWHLRHILTEQLTDIAFLFDASRIVEHILPLVVQACEDKFAAVREAGTRVFPIILESVKQVVEDDGETLSTVDGYGDDPIEENNKKNYAVALFNHVMDRIDEFARSDIYRGRLVFTQICRALIDASIDASHFASFFLPRLLALVYDPIVNVRIGVSQVIGRIYMNELFQKELNELSKDEEHNLDQMLYQLASDKDSDVRSFVIPFINASKLKKEDSKNSSTNTKELEESTP